MLQFLIDAHFCIDIRYLDEYKEGIISFFGPFPFPQIVQDELIQMNKQNIGLSSSI